MVPVFETLCWGTKDQTSSTTTSAAWSGQLLMRGLAEVGGPRGFTRSVPEPLLKAGSRILLS